LRVARGLFRLWLVLSVLWIGGVGIMTWWTFPVDDWIDPATGKAPERNPPPAGYVIDPPSSPRGPGAAAPSTGMFDHLIPKRGVRDKERWEAGRLAIVLALAPPAFILALGSAFVWAFRGFR
jgi:hypothetical protein